MIEMTTSDRRIAPRRQPALGTICRLNEAAGVKPAIGLVWNISHGGVSLLLHDPIQPGTAVRGELQTMTGPAHLPVNFRVGHLAKLLTGDYCVGGQFDRALADEDIKPFVA